MKVCFKCGEEKSLDGYYKNPSMSGGYSSKCKQCALVDIKERHLQRIEEEPGYYETYKRKLREKYHRLGYNEKYKGTRPDRQESNAKYRKKYPEKALAHKSSQKIVCKKGYNTHHWSYKEEHWQDLIELTVANHKALHRLLIYDQEHMQYRRSDTNELLDTRERHEDFIKEIFPP